jgi:hypothetical protein
MSLDTKVMAMALTGPVDRVFAATEKDRKTRMILWMIIVYPSCSSCLCAREINPVGSKCPGQQHVTTDKISLVLPGRPRSCEG